MKKTTKGNFFTPSILPARDKKNKLKSNKKFDIIAQSMLERLRKETQDHYDGLRGDYDYTPPNREHYPNLYKWDSVYAAIARARIGDTDGAIKELSSVLVGTHTDGFIPNVRFLNGRWLDPERKTFKNKNESSYTQPPLETQAALEIYKAFVKKGETADGRIYLASIVNNLQLSLKYFANTRENGDGSELIGIIHPHETGRDSGPEYDKYVKQARLTTIGANTPRLIGYVNSAIDYSQALALNFKLNAVNWNPKLAKEKRIFWANDVMFNCMYVNNLYDLAEINKILGNSDNEKFYQGKASRVEEEILTKMWDTKSKEFYGIDMEGKLNKKITVSNLYPLILPNISAEQTGRILQLLEDPSWFGTKYPIPSVPTNSRDYDPHFIEKRLWRGPVWINMNWHIAEALMFQSNRFADQDPILSDRLKNKALYIIKKTGELVDNDGMWEFYDPETGKGYRITPFAWSGLAKVLQHDHPEYLDSRMDEIYSSDEEAWDREDIRREQEREKMRKRIAYRIFEKL